MNKLITHYIFSYVGTPTGSSLDTSRTDLKTPTGISQYLFTSLLFVADFREQSITISDNILNVA